MELPDVVRSLSDLAAALIADSAIATTVAEARGYRTVRSRAELRRLGFSDTQCNVPALLIPVYDVRGDISLYQARPDTPRVVKGKALKYEMPKGSRMVIDVPPAARVTLADPAKPLFITEGIRKADAAVSLGLSCIALLGVWNWRGTNTYGGKTALADWELIALENRTVYLVFDSDVMQKTEVYAALVRLKSFPQQDPLEDQVLLFPCGVPAIRRKTTGCSLMS